MRKNKAEAKIVRFEPAMENAEKPHIPVLVRLTNFGISCSNNGSAIDLVRVLSQYEPPNGAKKTWRSLKPPT